MKRRVPKKNISRRIFDIQDLEARRRAPPPSLEKVREFISREKNDSASPYERVMTKRQSSRNVYLAVIAGIAILGSILGLALYREERNVLLKAAAQIEHFDALSREANLRRQGRGEEFGAVAENIRNLDPAGQSLASLGRTLFAYVLPFMKDSGAAMKYLTELADRTVVFAGEAEALEQELLDSIFRKRGGELIARLETIRTLLVEMDERGVKLALVGAKLKDILPVFSSSFFPGHLDFARAAQFLSALIDWLKSETPRHLAVFFGNTAELRPGGGFLGSYADLEIRGGNLESVEIHDIADADRTFLRRVVPPRPLQKIAKSWRIADANWFFDFEASAAAVLEFMESSEQYASRNTRFDGALHITPQVVGDLLALTGPLELNTRERTITKDNFLFEIQREIVEARDQGETHPKRILEELTPLLLQKLSRLDPGKRGTLFELAETWLREKDLVVYFKDETFEEFLTFHGWAGKLGALPEDGIGEYLAVVDANIGSGKTDTVLLRTLSLESAWGADGVLRSRLTIRRTHRGEKDGPSWQRTSNESYIKIFTHPRSKLISADGGEKREILPRVRYTDAGYAEHPLVKKIEDTREVSAAYPEVEQFEEFGRRVFGTWVKTDLGETSLLTFEYAQNVAAPLALGRRYHFVFDKQAGSAAQYAFRFYAPDGFVWKESGSRVYAYAADDPPRRIAIDLTLAKSK